MTERDPQTPVLFAESGSSLLWLLSGPAAAGMMVYIQFTSGAPINWLVPTVFFVLVTFFVGIMVFAARVHTSVQLTADELRQGTQITPVSEILGLYPEAPVRSATSGPVAMNPLTARALRRAGVDLEDEPEPELDDAAKLAEKWQAAPALGELTGVPKGRTGIGLQMAGPRAVQAWARNHRRLRAALTALLEQRAESGR